MSEGAPPLLQGMVLGGVMISAIGAGSMHFVDDKKPTVKSISRDFIVGAVMVALIMQILPESSSSLIHFLLSLAPLSLFKNSEGSTRQGFDTIGMVDDLEVKVGVPKF